MIPTSKSWEVLLFAIPSTRSFMTSEFDSTVYELPVTSTFPKTSRSEDITMAPLVLLIKESSRKFPVPTIGNLFWVRPATDMFEPTSKFAVVTRPVVAFVNWSTLEVVFPVSVTCWRVCSFVRRLAGTIFSSSLPESFTYTWFGVDVMTVALGISFALPTPVTEMIPDEACDFIQNPMF